MHPAIELRIQFGDQIPVHYRNDTLFNYACHFRDRGHPKKWTLSLCKDINKAHCISPLADQEVQKIVDSAYERYERRPSRQYQRFISDAATSVYVYLVKEQAGRNIWIKRSREDIATGTGVSARHVPRCIDALEEEGYLLVRPGGSGPGDKNLYYTLGSDEEQFTEKGDIRGTSVHRVLGCFSDLSDLSINQTLTAERRRAALTVVK